MPATPRSLLSLLCAILPAFCTPPKFAIIGGGAAGTSAAYWLSVGRTRSNLNFTIDLYERENYIGGRANYVYPKGNTTYGTIELGGNIFTTINHNMVKGAELYNLNAVPAGFGYNHDQGIWDGQQFRILIPATEAGQAGMFDRWGLDSFITLDGIVSDLLNKFEGLYDPSLQPFQTVGQAVTDMGFTTELSQLSSTYFDNAGVNPQFTRELIEGATRVNYLQNVDAIHAFGGFVCMSAMNPTLTVENGNRKIFEGFASSSGAQVYLNKPVKKVVKVGSSWVVYPTVGASKTYDGIILAAPAPVSGITFVPSLNLPAVQYVRLYVTLLTTTAQYPNSTYFNLPANATAPRVIITSYEGARNGGPAPAFNSMNYIRTVTPTSNEWVVKFFSTAPLTNAFLNQLFNNQVTWVYRKDWYAYPELVPVATSQLPAIKPQPGVYYANSFEPFVSTMETETDAGRNSADLVLKDFFNKTLCPTPSANPGIYPWEC